MRRSQKLFWSATLFFMIFLMTDSVFGQVATPPLDPTVRILKPAAASWRYIKGENESDDQRTATISIASYGGSGENDDGDEKWKVGRTQLLMLAKTENVNMEAFLIPTETRTDEVTTSGVTTETETKSSETQLNFAMLKRQFSFGGFYRATETKVGTLKAIKRTGMGGNATWQAKRVFFLTAGFENVEEDKSYKAANSWQNITWGGAMMAGKPDETQFRVEYSNTHSDRSEKTATGLYTNVHQETDDTILAAEVKMGKLVFSFQSQTVALKEWVEKGKAETTTEQVTLGFAMAPPNGVVFSGYYVSEKIDDNNESSKAAYIRLHVGYNF